MANEVRIETLGTLNIAKTQKQIQSQLDSISKNLKVTIGATTQSIKSETKASTTAIKTQTEAFEEQVLSIKNLNNAEGELIEQTTKMQVAQDKVRTEVVDATTGQIKYTETLDTAGQSAVKTAQAYEKMWNQAQLMNYEFDKKSESVALKEQQTQLDLVNAKLTSQVIKERELSGLSDGRITSTTSLLKEQAIAEDKLNAKKQKLIETLGIEKVKAQQVVEQSKHFGDADSRAQVEKYANQIKSLSVKTDMTEDDLTALNNQLKMAKVNMSGASQQARVLGNNSMTMGDMMKTAFEKFSVWISVTTIFFGAIRAIGDGIDAVIELDTALVELAKVTDLNTSELSAFTEQASMVGTTVARTTAEIVEASSAFARMGYSAQESLNLAEQAAILVNIGDGITDVDTAASAIIATLKGFNLNASETASILDKLNEVSNNFAVDTSDLATGIQRVSASMAAAGNDIDETLALFTSATEVLQDAQRASTAKLKVQDNAGCIVICNEERCELLESLKVA